jgi:glutamate synthase (NADPH/NADH) large chain
MALTARAPAYARLTPQLKTFYLDLQDERMESALGVVHSRFSTNTFPSWPLAHPFRRIAHNGEINTVTGNENWMRAREALIKTDIFGTDVEKIFPVCTPGASDSAPPPPLAPGTATVVLEESIDGALFM